MNQLFDEHMMDKNIGYCSDSQLVVTFGDGSKLFYQFNNVEIHKSFAKPINEWFDEININKYLSNHNYSTFKDYFDIIVFNSGNGPHYNLQSLYGDLKEINHLNKPIIYLSEFRDNKIFNADQKDVTIETRETLSLQMQMNRLYKLIPKLVYMDVKTRNRYLYLYNKTLIDNFLRIDKDGHYCTPGIIEHHSLSLLHLINALISLA